MKRKHLFLSLICSLILTVALVTVSVINIVPKKNNDEGLKSEQVSDSKPEDPNLTINDDRDGSAEKPYVIYSAESFNALVVNKYLDENGEYIDYTKVDDEGNLVYPELSNGVHYELNSDIDFAGTNFQTIFNKGIPFNGTIDGKGFTLKNININITKENLVDNYTYVKGTELVANIGVFGELENAKITNLTLDNVNVTMEEGLYSYVWSAEFKTEEGTMKSISVGSLAGLVNKSTIEVNTTAKIDGFAYAVYVNNIADGTFAVGGLVASAIDSTISNSKVNVEIIANQGAKYYVGGLVGCLKNTTVSNAEVNANVTTDYTKALYISGVVGYAIGANIDTVKVELAVNEINEARFSTTGVTSIDNTKFVSIAGAVHTININNNNTKTIVKNVEVKSEVDIDGIYAGAVMSVTGGKDEISVELTDIIVDSNVNVLKAYGFAGHLSYTKVSLSAENVKVELIDEEQVSFNVRLTGKVRLSVYTNKADGVRVFPASMYVISSDNSEGVTGGARKMVNIIVSSQIFDNTIKTETLVVKNWGSLVKV